MIDVEFLESLEEIEQYWIAHVIEMRGRWFRSDAELRVWMLQYASAIGSPRRRRAVQGLVQKLHGECA